MSTPVFIQIRCRPGTTYEVAEAILLKEIHSELYSTSGEYDLILKLYIPAGEDVGRFINDNLLDVPGIERSLTTMTFVPLPTFVLPIPSPPFLLGRNSHPERLAPTRSCPQRPTGSTGSAKSAPRSRLRSICRSVASKSLE